MGFIDPYYVVFLSYKVFTYKTLPQVWRLVTPFILTGPKIGLLMDPYFLYTYGSQLELEASRFSEPGDFFVYIAFVAMVILVSRTSFGTFHFLYRVCFLFLRCTIIHLLSARPALLSDSCNGS